jgi:peptidoglycan hydrolase CwlO-like protein
MGDDFDLTKAGTYKEALMLVNQSILLLNRDVADMKKMLEDMSDEQEAVANQVSDLDHKVEINCKDIKENKEKIAGFKKWNLADTVNLFVAGALAAVREFLN